LADDRLDLAPSAHRRQAVIDLREELDAVYRGEVRQPLLIALHALVRRIRLPRMYLDALVDGFAMDAEGTHYASAPALDLYAYRVAGVVGLAMCHVLGVRDERCLPRAAHLGMAMQLTNICRDVLEDWHSGRQYLPRDLATPDELRQAAEVSPAADSARATVALAVASLLARAEAYYESGLEGLHELGWRSALAIGAAARIYRAIGRRIAKQRFDVFAGRAVVPLPAKLVLAFASAFSLLLDLPRRWRRGKARLSLPTTSVRFSDVQRAV
jgi:phytoene synthase